MKEQRKDKQRRSSFERRIFNYTTHIPERRYGERRVIERRKVNLI